MKTPLFYALLYKIICMVIILAFAGIYAFQASETNNIFQSLPYIAGMFADLGYFMFAWMTDKKSIALLFLVAAAYTTFWLF